MGSVHPNRDLDAAPAATAHPRADAVDDGNAEIEIRIEFQYQGLIARQELEAVFGEGLISP